MVREGVEAGERVLGEAERDRGQAHPHRRHSSSFAFKIFPSPVPGRFLSHGYGHWITETSPGARMKLQISLVWKNDSRRFFLLNVSWVQLDSLGLPPRYKSHCCTFVVYLSVLIIAAIPRHHY